MSQKPTSDQQGHGLSVLLALILLFGLIALEVLDYAASNQDVILALTSMGLLVILIAP
jgi:hypothetical protein